MGGGGHRDRLRPIQEAPGACAALIRAFDWSATALGPLTDWPPSLVSTVGLVLHCRNPMLLWWGPHRVQIYNDAVIPSLGSDKHPAALGQSGRACWGELWSVIAAHVDPVMSRGEASWSEDGSLPIRRNGHIEEVYWTYGYSPVFGDDGAVAGVLVVCTETTSRVLATRRARLLQSLGTDMLRSDTIDELLALAIASLEQHAHDLPFVRAYRRRPGGETWDGVGSTQLSDRGADALDAIVCPLLESGAVVAGPALLPVEVSLTTRAPAWPELVTRAIITRSGAFSGHALVIGLSPRLPFDDAYRELVGGIVDQLGAKAARIEVRRFHAVVEGERRELLEQAPVGAAILSGPSHVYVLANARYRELVGGRPLLGRSYLEAFPELAGLPVVDMLDHAYREGRAWLDPEYHLKLARAEDGVLVDHYYAFSVSPIRDAHGHVYGLMVVAIAVTEQVDARRALERSSVEREKLLVALEAANHAKDEFLATVSHELRTPLTSILGWARILRGDPGSVHLDKGLEVINRNAEAQIRLIDDILDISRIISGKLRLAMRRVDVARLVRGAADGVTLSAGAKGVQLTVEVDPDVGTLTGDYERLQQVVWNLIVNGVKFTAAGGHVAVRARRELGEVVITVTDDGDGIAPEFLPHVFERFSQADSSTTKRQGGLGLGLGIARDLVELHGGRLAAHSLGTDHGSSFEVRLPAGPPAETSVPPSARDREGAAGRRSVPHGPLAEVRILVVDDDPDAREMVATVLSTAGAEVIQVASAEAALRALATEAFGVLVSDIGMPVLDGYGLMRRLRAETHERHDVPALALSAYTRHADSARSLAAGFQAHAAKPIDPARLVEAVAALVVR